MTHMTRRMTRLMTTACEHTKSGICTIESLEDRTENTCWGRSCWSCLGRWLTTSSLLYCWRRRRIRWWWRMGWSRSVGLCQISRRCISCIYTFVSPWSSQAFACSSLTCSRRRPLRKV